MPTPTPSAERSENWMAKRQRDAPATKHTIDTKVAGLLDIHVSQVALITSTFLRVASIHLAQRGELFLDSFGKFHRAGPKVFFRKSRRLRTFLEEIAMEKLGVDEGADQEEMEKAATQGCPECGATVEKHGRLLSCPNHGTAPFEKKTAGK